MVDWGGLENRCSLAATEGSNPSLSVIGNIQGGCTGKKVLELSTSCRLPLNVGQLWKNIKRHFYLK